MMFNIYARKSVWTDEGESIESQINICKEYIEKHFSDVPDKRIYVYKDEGFSGKDTKRPQYLEMLKSLEKEKCGYIICYKLDRISRSISDFSSLIDKLSKKNISFISVKEHFDTSNPVGRGMMYICAVFAQMERESIAERVRDSMLFLAKKGRWLGGVTPFGFDAVRTSEDIVIDGRPKKASYLKPNEDINIVKLIYKKYLELGSSVSVSRYLDSENIKDSKNQDITRATILCVLDNPVYCAADKDAFDYFSSKTKNVFFKPTDFYKKLGIIAYNRTSYPKPNHVSDWIIALGRHKGVISGKDWLQAQNLLHRNSHKPCVDFTNSIFSSMICCPQCGSAMYAKKALHNKFYYICSNKMHWGKSRCNAKNIDGQNLDQEILQEILKLDINELKNKNHMKKNTHVYNKLDDQIYNNKYTISKLKDSKSHYITYLQRLDSTSPLINDIENEVSSINSQISKLTSETYDLETKLRKNQNEKIDLENMIKTFEELKNNFNTLDFKTKKSLARLLVEKITWYYGKPVVIYNGI